MESTEEKVVRFGDAEEGYDLWVHYQREPRLLSVDDPDGRIQLAIFLDENDYMKSGSFIYQVDEEQDGEINQRAFDLSHMTYKRGEHITEAVKRLKEKYRFRWDGLYDMDVAMNTSGGLKDEDIIPILPLDRSAWPVPLSMPIRDSSMVV